MNTSVKLRTQAIVLTILLIVQYLLGMITALYVQLPQNVSANQVWDFAWSQWALAAHIALGIGLLLGAIVLLVRAYHYKQSAWVQVAWLGLVGILIAGFAGSLFVDTQTAAYSLVMALSFLLAAGSYGWGIARISTK